ncbi:X-linked retinitis pigmentosa GTPase regulator-like [Rhagoletis pomonella]|uniref:X-linked retinitis pigmentosa GTPase regulator-like n=1 Tax=Rhagoletis pomonella TaxID=28610 RepID=UPI00177AF5BB|nr:X-linked retinitis pigmentosa GTPase regulator-like [Rhagoletis pomonella]
MDIPNTGAIFTLGKSYLAENTQSYFYIKNDPVKRLISGPHQSAVICESGRLFVWGENYYGQLGIGSQSNNNNSNNSKSNGNTRSNGDIITKPTCVKSLKTLGLKIADIAFGNDWSIILTHSNELFFSGRNIFPAESNVARNFTTATVANEQCEIIRKPFRIDELDDYLAKNEDAECYTNVLAGNEHFVLMTSFGRLIAWGSNQNYQLGLTKHDSVQMPHEINLGAPVQQFVCGPESTLVLTTTGKLFFTGHLNEFVFSQFTELQQNLAPTEQIIFMHISKTNEIYIVTNSGSIYRSMESLRTKSLIFQRFYDYDSEENGPIWKLLKGFSFYAVLTKANKFYTTFSESGHHLKTFREISKFKNLRLLDVAVGNQHILVHGLPRNSTISAAVGPGYEPHRFSSRTFVMPATLLDGPAERNQNRESKAAAVENKNNETIEKDAAMIADVNSNTINIEGDGKLGLAEKNRETDTTTKNDAAEVKAEESVSDELGVELTSEHLNGEISENKVNTMGELNENKNHSGDIKDTHLITSAAVIEHNEASSPSGSENSKKSRHSVKFSPTSASKASPISDKLLRPHTPYPESSTTASTPTTIKKTPLRNYSYEAAMEHDHIDSTSPALMDSLDNIPESTEAESEIRGVSVKNALASSPTLPFEEDEQLTVEINTTTDPLNSTIVVNEIRFINNGVDVTDNVKAESFERDDTESTLDSLEEQAEDIDRKSNGTPNEIDNSANTDAMETHKTQVDVTRMSNKFKNAVDEIESGVENTVQSKITKINEYVAMSKDNLSKQAEHSEEDITSAPTELMSHTEKASKTFTDTIGNAAKKAAATASDVRHSLESAAKGATSGALDAVESVGENAKNVANDAMNTVEGIGNSAKKAATGAKNAVGNVFIKMSDGTKDAVDSVATKIANEVQSAKENINTMLQGKVLKPPPTEEDAVSSASDVASKEGAKTNTTTGEDDERTTASVNSTQNSTGNPFENSNPFETTNPFDDVIERSKKALQEEANTFRQEVVQETEKEKGKVRQFFSDFRGISCRNEKSVEVDDDPPRYSVEDKYPTTRRDNSNQENTSKVCSIL